MQKLIEEIHQFQQTIFDTEKRLFERLAQGQQPLACSSPVPTRGSTRVC